MIVSGLPRENGNTHVQHIAEIALKMRVFVGAFKLAHRPEETLMVRIGMEKNIYYKDRLERLIENEKLKIDL